MQNDITPPSSPASDTPPGWTHWLTTLRKGVGAVNVNNLWRCIFWRLREYPPEGPMPQCVIDEILDLKAEIDRIHRKYSEKREKQKAALQRSQLLATQKSAAAKKLPRILALWQSRLPERPYCTNDFETGVRIRPTGLAVTLREIQPNKPWENQCLVIDLDHAHDLPVDVPPPNILVTNPVSGHRHAFYLWKTPILIGPNASRKAQNFFTDVAIALRIALNGDPAYQGTLCHNPLHPHWQLEILVQKPYQLRDFREVLDRIKATHRLPRRGRQDDTLASLGRNCATWESCRRLAYTYGPQQDLLDRVTADVNAYNLQNNSPPLSDRECHHIAKSIANYVQSGRHQLFVSRTHSPKLQAQRGRNSGKARRSRSEGARATAVALYRDGKKQTEIAEILAVHQSTVCRWLKAYPKICTNLIRIKAGTAGKSADRTARLGRKGAARHRGQGGGFERRGGAPGAAFRNPATPILSSRGDPPGEG